MDDRSLATQLAFGRIGAGIALLLAPGLVGTVWLGRDLASRPGTRVLLRALGVRDLVIGLGLQRALSGSGSRRQAIQAGLAADSVDLAATLLAGDDLPATGRFGVGALAASGVGLGIKLLLSPNLGDDESPAPAAGPAPADVAARDRAASLT